MKRKNIWKKSISLLLIISLVFGMTWTGTWAQAATNVPEGLEDYTRLNAEAFGITEEVVHSGGGIWATYTPNGVTSLDKKYVDADFSFEGGSGLADSIRYMGGEMYMIYIAWEAFYIYDFHNGKALYNTLLTDLGIAEGEYFNLKIATDISTNASDASKSDVTFKVWINNKVVKPDTAASTTDSITSTVNTTSLTQSMIVSSGTATQTIKIKPHVDEVVEPDEPVVPNVPEGLEDYTKMTPATFGIGEEVIHTLETDGNIWITYTANDITSFDKKYFDVDISSTSYEGLDNRLNYMGDEMFLIYVGWNEFRIYCLETNTMLYQSTLSSLELTAGEYFNLKIATDLSTNASDDTKTDVTLKVWLNNRVLKPLGAADNVDSVTHTVNTADLKQQFTVAMTKAGTIKIKPQVSQGPLIPDVPDVPDVPDDTEIEVPELSDDADVKEVLKDYVRVTPESFAIIDEVFAHGWIEGNWMGYEYPESLDHTYLDVNISLCQDNTLNNVFRYLSKNGWESLLIGIVGEELRVFETSTNTYVYQIPLAEAGIAADRSFNMKLSTDISGNTVMLSLWINDKLVRPIGGEAFAVVKGCQAIGNMIGIYLPYEGTIRIETPETSGGGEQKPNITEQPSEDLKKITFENFAIKDSKYGYIGPELGAEGAYIFSVNGTVFSGDFHFSKAGGADFRYGGKGNPWNGLRFWTTGDGKLYMQDATEKTGVYTFHPLYAGVQLVDNTFNMKLSVEFVDSDSDGVKDDVKLGVWFNDVFYKNSYIYLTDYAQYLGNACAVFVMNPDSWIRISSDKTVYTGVDFTLFGFTTNWKKELGIK